MQEEGGERERERERGEREREKREEREREEEDEEMALGHVRADPTAAPQRYIAGREKKHESVCLRA